MQFIAHRPEGWSAIPASFFGFFVLGARPLIIEPCEQGNSTRHIGGEYAIAVFRSVEQRILLGLVVLPQTVFLLLIPQSEETMLFAPALRAVPELALPVGIGLRRSRPVGRFQFIHQA